jgi:hypothetical protein
MRLSANRVYRGSLLSGTLHTQAHYTRGSCRPYLALRPSTIAIITPIETRSIAVDFLARALLIRDSRSLSLAGRPSRRHDRRSNFFTRSPATPARPHTKGHAAVFQDAKHCPDHLTDRAARLSVPVGKPGDDRARLMCTEEQERQTPDRGRRVRRCVPHSPITVKGREIPAEHVEPHC